GSLLDLRNTVMLLGKLATLMNIPVITTASEPNGTNGPLIPEVQQSAPQGVYVPRKGEVNAWDNEDFVRTVRDTGRKTLIMAGVRDRVFVLFPTPDATADGYDAYAGNVAFGSPNQEVPRTSPSRLVP